MRWAVLVSILATLGACGDPGLRDRSLSRTVDARLSDSVHALVDQLPKKRPPKSPIIGLMKDPLAALYAERSPLVLRFSELAALEKEAGEQLAEVARLLPGLGLPQGTPGQFLRQITELRSWVSLDSPRPFACVLTPEGWAAIVPTRDRSAVGMRLKPLDGIYSVAGTEEVVAAYTPGFRKGYYLPGHCSVIARPEALPKLGTKLTGLLEALGIDLTVLDGGFDFLSADVERVDISFRFLRASLRVDLRLAPSASSPTSLALERLQPQPSTTARFLPKGGTIYLEMCASPPDLKGLHHGLLGQPVETRAELPADRLALREALRTLDQDVTCMLELEPDGTGRAILLAKLGRPDAVREFFRSEHMPELLQLVAGPGGRLVWRPGVFTRYGAPVGTVTGNISRSRLSTWRQGNAVQSTLGVLLRGPVVAYVAVLKSHLCVVVSQKSRADAERFLDTVRAGEPQFNEHVGMVHRLFRTRLMACSADLGALFDGGRVAAAHWHERGRELRDLDLRKRLPAACAVTAEGGALRVAVSLPPRALAEAVAKILEALDSAD
jgi:hypothetical protein